MLIPQEVLQEPFLLLGYINYAGSYRKGLEPIQDSLDDVLLKDWHVTCT